MPFHPSTEPPASYRKIFSCGHAPGHHTPQCTVKILRDLTERAYRRPVKPAEVTQLAGLVALAQRSGDSFEEGIRLAVQTILMSPDFLFRTEADPAANGGTLVEELATVQST